MSESLRLVDELWNEAAELVGRIESLCRSDVPELEVYQRVVRQLCSLTGARAASLWTSDSENIHQLSEFGEAPVPPALPTVDNQDRTNYRAPFAKQINATTIQTIEVIAPTKFVGLTCCFDERIDDQRSAPLRELCETLVGLVSTVYLRYQFRSRPSSESSVDQRDQLIQRLYAGYDAQESLNNIASVVAQQTSADRVLVFKKVGESIRLVAASTQPKISRRARQSRLSESLVNQIVQHKLGSSRTSPFAYAVGEGEATGKLPAELRRALDDYLNDSGARELFVQRLESSTILLLERYRLPESPSQQLGTHFSGIQSVVSGALGRANKQDQFRFHTAWSAVRSSLFSRRSGMITGFLLACCLALIIIPADLAIPANGRIVPEKQRGLFAPMDAVVEEVLVTNGQSIQADQPLVILRSASLDRHQQQLRGQLATARSQLAVISALRTQDPRERSDPSQRNLNPLASSDQEVLKTEIEGLQSQLDLVAKQQQELTLRSPIDGEVNRWELERSFLGRPVIHGQHLLDVVDTTNQWQVELEIDDSDSQHVYQAQADQACVVRFRPRSKPDQEFMGSISWVSNVSELNSKGRSIVRAKLKVDNAMDHQFRSGTTVQAHIHCGRQALGMVWLRGAITWARQQGWI